MRIASFELEGRLRTGRVEGEELVPFPPGVTIESLLPDLSRARDLPTEAPLPAGRVRWLPPVPRPAKILCAGANFEPHRVEMGRPRPDHPLIFARFADGLVGHEGPLMRPRESEALDYEGELAVIVGRACRRVRPEDSRSVIAGFCAFDDGTVRDWQRHTSQFTPGKNFPDTAALGPWLVTADEIPDPGALELQTRVNGEVRQSGRICELTFSIETLLAYVSTFTRLEPGDVLATGTPAGVGAAHDPPRWLRPADVVEVEISQVGTLRNRVVQEGPAEAEPKIR